MIYGLFMGERDNWGGAQAAALSCFFLFNYFHYKVLTEAEVVEGY